MRDLKIKIIKIEIENRKRYGNNGQRSCWDGQQNSSGL